MLRLRSRKSEQLAATRRIKTWTRRRFGLADDVPMMVAEVACGLPGCPPVETVVAFWTTPRTRHAFKAFKPANEVTEDDLPPRWMKDAIIRDDEDLACC